VHPRALALAAALAALPSAADAFVGLSPSSAPAGTEITATFVVEHGCAGSPTVRLRIAMPQGVRAVKALDTPGWKASAAYASAADDAPVSEVVWIGGKLAPETSGAFAVALRLPDAPGTTLYFPVTQDCEKGTIRWAETPTATTRADALRLPAPSLSLSKRP
jgi:uncharacterized protein YcnI